MRFHTHTLLHFETLDLYHSEGKLGKLWVLDDVDYMKNTSFLE